MQIGFEDTSLDPSQMSSRFQTEKSENQFGSNTKKLIFEFSAQNKQQVLSQNIPMNQFNESLSRELSEQKQKGKTTGYQDQLRHSLSKVSGEYVSQKDCPIGPKYKISREAQQDPFATYCQSHFPLNLENLKEKKSHGNDWTTFRSSKVFYYYDNVFYHIEELLLSEEQKYHLSMKNQRRQIPSSYQKNCVRNSTSSKKSDSKEQNCSSAAQNFMSKPKQDDQLSNTSDNEEIPFPISCTLEKQFSRVSELEDEPGTSKKKQKRSASFDSLGSFEEREIESNNLKISQFQKKPYQGSMVTPLNNCLESNKDENRFVGSLCFNKCDDLISDDDNNESHESEIGAQLKLNKDQESNSSHRSGHYQRNSDYQQSGNSDVNDDNNQDIYLEKKLNFAGSFQNSSRNQPLEHQQEPESLRTSHREDYSLDNDKNMFQNELNHKSQSSCKLALSKVGSFQRQSQEFDLKDLKHQFSPKNDLNNSFSDVCTPIQQQRPQKDQKLNQSDIPGVLNAQDPFDRKSSIASRYRKSQQYGDTSHELMDETENSRHFQQNCRMTSPMNKYQLESEKSKLGDADMQLAQRNLVGSNQSQKQLQANLKETSEFQQIDLSVQNQSNHQSRNQSHRSRLILQMPSAESKLNSESFDNSNFSNNIDNLKLNLAEKAQNDIDMFEEIRDYFRRGTDEEDSQQIPMVGDLVQDIRLSQQRLKELSQSYEKSVNNGVKSSRDSEFGQESDFIHGNGQQQTDINILKKNQFNMASDEEVESEDDANNLASQKDQSDLLSENEPMGGEQLFGTKHTFGQQFSRNDNLQSGGIDLANHFNQTGSQLSQTHSSLNKNQAPLNIQSTKSNMLLQQHLSQEQLSTLNRYNEQTESDRIQQEELKQRELLEQDQARKTKEQVFNNSSSKKRNPLSLGPLSPNSISSSVNQKKLSQIQSISFGKIKPGNPQAYSPSLSPSISPVIKSVKLQVEDIGLESVQSLQQKKAVMTNEFNTFNCEDPKFMSPLDQKQQPFLIRPIKCEVDDDQGQSTCNFGAIKQTLAPGQEQTDQKEDDVYLEEAENDCSDDEITVMRTLMQKIKEENSIFEEHNKKLNEQHDTACSESEILTQQFIQSQDEFIKLKTDIGQAEQDLTLIQGDYYKLLEEFQKNLKTSPRFNDQELSAITIKNNSLDSFECNLSPYDNKAYLLNSSSVLTNKNNQRQQQLRQANASINTFNESSLEGQQQDQKQGQGQYQSRKVLDILNKSLKDFFMPGLGPNDMSRSGGNSQELQMPSEYMLPQQKQFEHIKLNKNRSESDDVPQGSFNQKKPILGFKKQDQMIKIEENMANQYGLQEENQQTNTNNRFLKLNSQRQRLSSFPQQNSSLMMNSHNQQPNKQSKLANQEQYQLQNQSHRLDTIDELSQSQSISQSMVSVSNNSKMNNSQMYQQQLDGSSIQVTMKEQDPNSLSLSQSFNNKRPISASSRDLQKRELIESKENIPLNNKPSLFQQHQNQQGMGGSQVSQLKGSPHIHKHTHLMNNSSAHGEQMGGLNNYGLGTSDNYSSNSKHSQSRSRSRSNSKHKNEWVVANKMRNQKQSQLKQLKLMSVLRDKIHFQK